MKGKAKIKISLLILSVLIILVLTDTKYFPALLLSIAIHESGHILIAKMRRIEICEFKLGIFGAALVPQGTLISYADEIALCLGGPVSNFLTASLGMLLFKLPSTSLFIQASFALGTLNLFPIIGFDGGRILSAILEKHFSQNLSFLIMKTISFIFLFSLWVFSLYIMMRSGASLGIFIFSLSMFARIFLQEKIPK